MNYFSKSLIYTYLFLFSFSANALEIKSFYLSSCDREVGVISKIGSSHVYLFNVDGKSVRIPRYEIVGIGVYPIDKFPAKKLTLKEGLRPSAFSISTLYKNEITPLVTGWPIAFSKDKMTLLSDKGEEITFARNNIWGIEEIESKPSYILKKQRSKMYDFLHPTSLAKCKKRIYGQGETTIKISPQEFVSDPITIKRKLDKFSAEMKVVRMYTRSQSFYAIPEVYKNQTTLGLWMYGGARHGASNNRANNWAPILENQFSSGPYGYQHIFLTGADTNNFFMHEEPQTQIFYRFKADYFHLSYYMDPTLILMGKRYRWFDDELGSNEYRLNDMSFIELGFDYGYFSLLMQISSEIQLGYKGTDGYFYDGQLTIPKYGFEYKSHKRSLSFLVGTASENVRSDDLKDNAGNVIGNKIAEFNVDFLRVNYAQKLNEKWGLNTSFIQTKVDFDKKVTDNTTIALEGEYQYSHKYIFKVLTSNERVSNDEKDSSFFKLGLSGNLVF